MSWGYVAVGAIAVVSSMAASDAQDEGLGNSRVAQYQNQQATYKQNIADNKAIAEMNLANTVRTGIRVGLLNVQAGQARKQAIQQGISLSVQKQALMGANAANAAAAGTIGSSVDAVSLDIQNKVGEAQAQLDANAVQQEANFDVQLRDLIMSGIDSLRGPQSYVTQAVSQGGYSSSGSAIAAGLVAVGSTWASNNMSLGLGSAGSSGGTANVTGTVNTSQNLSAPIATGSSPGFKL